jgi:hypothetical protein
MGTPHSRIDATSTTKATAGSPIRRLAVAVVIIVVLVLAVVAYYRQSGFFAANGTWYGPMRVKDGAVTVSIETYMNVTVNPLGVVSGSGTFCIPLPFNNSTSTDLSLQGSHDFVHPGDSDPLPIKITVDYAISLPLGLSLPIGPQLTMHGNIIHDKLTFLGGDSNGTTTTLAMQQGSKSDFTTACKSLSPIG